MFRARSAGQGRRTGADFGKSQKHLLLLAPDQTRPPHLLIDSGDTCLSNTRGRLTPRSVDDSAEQVKEQQP
ncbi:unnamed protein product [Lota lota]